MKSALDVHRDLLARDVRHEVVRVRDGVALGADDLPRALRVDASLCLVVRCYVTDVALAAALVGAGVVPDPAAVLDALGACSLRAATADEVSAATDFPAGLVCPVGLPVEVRLLADTALAGLDVVYCPLGEGGVALGIRTADLLAVTGARVVALSPVPQPRITREAGSAGRVIDLDRLSAGRREPRRAG